MAAAAAASASLNDVTLAALHELASATVCDEDGRDVPFGSLYSDRKAIIVFVRHFLCFICKEYVEDLAQVPPANVEGVRIIVIGCAKHTFIKAFKRDTRYAYEIYSDAERKIYQHLGLISKMSMPSGESAHVKSGMLAGTLKSTWRAIKGGLSLQGNVNQQGGAFVIAPGPQVLFAHHDADPFDHADINTLLAVAGCQEHHFVRSKQKDEQKEEETT